MSVAKPLPPKFRFLHRNGDLAVRRIGVRNSNSRDLYYALMAMPWWQFFLVQGTAFAGISMLFALLYWWPGNAIGGARPGSLMGAFFFSVHTLGTIGYGSMVPLGIYANVLVCLQAYTGLTCIALMTGLAFARFSLPDARVVFSQHLVVNRRNGIPVLQVRMVNARGNRIVQAEVRLTVVLSERTQEGEWIRRLIPLALVTSATPVFALSFTATHTIDETSPLWGLDGQALEDRSAEFGSCSRCPHRSSGEKSGPGQRE